MKYSAIKLLRLIGLFICLSYSFYFLFDSFTSKQSNDVNKSQNNNPPALLRYESDIQLIKQSLKGLNQQLETLIHFHGNQTIQSQSEGNIQHYKKVNEKLQRTAILFTMDSISSYEENSLRGGASGEIIIRKSLEKAFELLGHKLIVMSSDLEFESTNMNDYNFIILDPWTWAAKGWVPKQNIVGFEDKVYILDFFGSKNLRGDSFNIPPHRFLTAFGSPSNNGNTFLGYMISEDIKPFDSSTKSDQGVIWGKDPRHFENQEKVLSHAAERVSLVATISTPIQSIHSNIRFIGLQTKDQWLELLQNSKFLLGLGNPLAGPSAIDAIAHGCMFINPIYNKPVREEYTSQHPYAMTKIGIPYVCSYHEGNLDELDECISKALSSPLDSHIPIDFQVSNYLKRVQDIFHIENLIS